VATAAQSSFTTGLVTARRLPLINGVHAILFSADADATRAALAKVLGTWSVDAGGGWLIFALPPAEIAVHPATEEGRAELYLMTDDVAATVAALQAEGIEVARPISDQGWGLLTAITLPGGVDLGLCQPRHPTATRPSRASVLARKAAAVAAV
jgi:hypothetical protein